MVVVNALATASGEAASYMKGRIGMIWCTVHVCVRANFTIFLDLVSDYGSKECYCMAVETV